MADELADWEDVAALIVEQDRVRGDVSLAELITSALRAAHEAGVVEGRMQVCREVDAARRLEVDDE
jgi:hypothetical protein